MPKVSFLSGCSVTPASNTDYLRSDLKDIVNVFQEQLYLPDTTPLLVALATYASFLVPGRNPLWMMLVGGSSSGKTEAINALRELPNVHWASELNASGLLSGSSKKDRDRDSTGGLLKQIGESDFLGIKDFTSVLSLSSEKLQAVLSALREIHDGKWSRTLGSDGGRVHEWEGNLGLIAGVTSAIDRHTEVMNSLGEPFLYLRMPEFDSSERKEFAKIAAQNANDEKDWAARAALVESFIDGLDVPSQLRALTKAELNWLSNLATLASQCRSGVDFDGYRREVIGVHYAEMPGRITKQLMRLLVALEVIGVTSPYKYELVRRVAFDCLPPIRLKIVRYLAGKQRVSTPTIASSINLPSSTLWRALTALKMHMVVEAYGANDAAMENEPQSGKKGAPSALWSLTTESRELWDCSRNVGSSLLADDANHFRNVR